MKPALRYQISKMNYMLNSYVEPEHNDMFTIVFLDVQTGLVEAWDNDVYYSYEATDKARHNYNNYMGDNDMNLIALVVQYTDPSPSQANLEAVIGKIKKGSKS